MVQNAAVAAMTTTVLGEGAMIGTQTATEVASQVAKFAYDAVSFGNAFFTTCK
jgi:hypothetical protein